MRCHLVKSAAAGIAGCLGMQVQCIIHVIFVIGVMDSQDMTVDDVISCESAGIIESIIGETFEHCGIA